jgi:hypothetical protein
VKPDNVVNFPPQPIDGERVRLESDEPCTILMLPAVSIERRGLADWVEALIAAAVEGKHMPSPGTSSDHTKSL